MRRLDQASTNSDKMGTPLQPRPTADDLTGNISTCCSSASKILMQNASKSAPVESVFNSGVTTCSGDSGNIRAATFFNCGRMLAKGGLRVCKEGELEVARGDCGGVVRG